MKIREITIDGFGVWRNLQLPDLGAGLNVYYGANEAGKTTLLECVRAVLYGFTPERDGYLPPVRGGSPGGSIVVAEGDERVEIRRHLFERATAPGGELFVSGGEGDATDEVRLATFLRHVDETTFKRVFAVGLDELAALSTLSDTAATEHLFHVSAGIGGASLVEVLPELAASRLRILDDEECPSQVAQLQSERRRLRQELAEAATACRRYAQIAHERDQIDGRIAEIQVEAEARRRELALVEVSLAVRERWGRREALDLELARIGASPQINPADVTLVKRCKRRLARLVPRHRSAKAAAAVIETEMAQLAQCTPLVEHGPRIEFLSQQKGWVQSVERNIDEIELRILELDSRQEAEQARLGLTGDAWRNPSGRGLGREIRRVAGYAKAFRLRRAESRQAREDQAARRAEVESLSAQIVTALAGRPGKDLSSTLSKSGNLVSQLRRAMQLDERLSALRRHKDELEDQLSGQLERNFLPVKLLLGLGAPFVLGIVLVLVGLFFPATMTVGWFLVALGMVTTAAAGVAKMLLERAAIQRHDAGRKQLDLLGRQTREAEEERKTLHQKLPSGGGPLTARLQAAETDLAALEAVVPLDSRRQTSEAAAAEAQAKASAANKSADEAQRRWRGALKSLRLPPNWSPKQVRHVVKQSRRIEKLTRPLAPARQELADRRASLSGIAEQVAGLVQSAGLTPRMSALSAQIEQLREDHAAQQQIAARRTELDRKRAAARRDARRIERAIRQAQRRRKAAIERLGVSDESSLSELTDRFRRREELVAERERIGREIAAAIADASAGAPGTSNEWSEDQLRLKLTDRLAVNLDERRRELVARDSTASAGMSALFENRGRLTQELATLAADRRLDHLQLDLGIIEERLRAAIERWQVLAATEVVLDDVRRMYERDRQPETLCEASIHFGRFTEGQYTRIWTPLGERTLWVDDREGRRLAVESLSRGTREQLFLSLRLALVALYARRGAELPLTLDDVLVNFDAQRAKVAASVLKEFAAEGHQVILLTCHDHLFKLFKSQKIKAERLPAHGALAAAESPPAAAPRRKVEERPIPAPPTEPLPEIVVDVEDFTSSDGAPVDDPPWFDQRDTANLDSPLVAEPLSPIEFAEPDLPEIAWTPAAAPDAAPPLAVWPHDDGLPPIVEEPDEDGHLTFATDQHSAEQSEPGRAGPHWLVRPLRIRDIQD